MKRVATMCAVVTMVTAVGLLSSGCSTLCGGKKSGQGQGSCGAKMEKACCGTCKTAEKPAGEATAAGEVKPAGEAKAACPADCSKPCCAKK